MSGYLLKQADADASYCLNWSDGYLQQGERVESDLGWLIHRVVRADELSIKTQLVKPTQSVVEVSGGVPGNVYMLSARVMTTAGRALERAIVLRIAA